MLRTLYKTYLNYSPAAWAVVLPSLALAVFALVVLHRLALADDANRAAVYHAFLIRQAVFLAFAVIVMVVVAGNHYLKITRIAYALFGLTVLTLLAVLVFGWLGQYVPLVAKIFPRINYSYRWIRLGFIQIQPSEFLKITYILALAHYLRYRRNYRRFAGLIAPFAFAVLPMVLILLEPDLGTVMLLMPVLFLMLFAAGARTKHLAQIVLLMVLASPGLFLVMEPYQRGRLVGTLLQFKTVQTWYDTQPKLRKLVYLRDLRDQTRKWPEGYQLYHSKLAVASGSVAGFGRELGPYTAGTFRLPHCHNDFIFSLIAHQFGFIGALAVIILYLILAAGLIDIAGACAEPAGRLVAVGAFAMILTQSTINMAMTVGLMPITGVNLPFVSYGGSSLLTFFILIGFAVSVDRTRPVTLGPKSFEFKKHEPA